MMFGRYLRVTLTHPKSKIIDHPNVTLQNETRMVHIRENVGLSAQNQPSTHGCLLKFEFESNGGASVQVALLGKWTRMVDLKKSGQQISIILPSWHNLIGTLYHVSLLLGQPSFEVALIAKP